LIFNFDSKIFIEYTIYLWATINGVPGIKLATAIDNMVDGGDGLTVGNFQTTHSNAIYHLKIIPTNYP